MLIVGNELLLVLFHLGWGYIVRGIVVSCCYLPVLFLCLIFFFLLHLFFKVLCDLHIIFVKWCFVFVLSVSYSFSLLNLTVAFYIRLVWRQLQFSGYLYFVLKLQIRVLTICGELIIFMVFYHVFHKILMYFCWIICHLLDFGKCWMSLMNIFIHISFYHFYIMVHGNMIFLFLFHSALCKSKFYPLKLSYQVIFGFVENFFTWQFL